MIKTFCVAHKPVMFDLPQDTTVVWLGTDNPVTRNCSDVLRAAEYCVELHEKHEFLAGSAGSFIIEKFLVDNPYYWDSEDLLSIIQYRKFISPSPVGKASATYHGMYIVNEVEAEFIDIQLMHDATDGRYLLSQIGGVGGVMAQYNNVHRIEDFLRYLAIAVECGIVERDEFIDYVARSFIIPGGIEFGILPISVYLNLIKKLRIICTEFLKIHKPVSNDPYQTRALAFCNERLGSYLLLKHLFEKLQINSLEDLPSNLLGYMHTVVPEGEFYA